VCFTRRKSFKGVLGKSPEKGKDVRVTTSSSTVLAREIGNLELSK
jgi:hypothetical protein